MWEKSGTFDEYDRGLAVYLGRMVRKMTTMNLVNEAKTVGAAMAHGNANWEEGTHLAVLFFRGRDLAHLIATSPNAATDRARSAEYRAAYDAFFDAYYAR